MSLFFGVLAALFAVVLWVSFRGLRVISFDGAGSRALLVGVSAALREGEETGLAGIDEPRSSVGRALADALVRRERGERPELAAREAAIEARARVGRTLTPLRVGATLASTLGLLGALHAYLTGPEEVMPLELLERGAIEADALGRAALSVAAGLGVHAYAMQAYAALRRDGLILVRALGDLEDVLASLREEKPRAP